MSFNYRVVKDPDAELPYGFDWSAWLADMSGEVIDTAVWTVPTGLTLVSQSETDTVATAVISGGAAGNQYNVACKITTTSGYDDERTMVISCRQR